MTSLPIVDQDQADSSRARGRPARPWAIPVHICRVGLFIGILLLVRQKHIEFLASRSEHEQLDLVQLNSFLDSMPHAVELKPFQASSQSREFADAENRPIGSLVQTSPKSDSIVGYIGPTNLAVAVGATGTIAEVQILQSADTVEHVDAIRDSTQFLKSFQGLDWNQPALWPEIDAVSGATLSSYAIAQSVAAKAGGEVKPLKFPNTISDQEIESVFGPNTNIGNEPKRGLLRPIELGSKSFLEGYIARTSPHSDALPGYQGPTDSLIAFDKDRRLSHIRVRSSFDNEPYVGYVEEDRYLESLLKGKTLKEILVFDESQYEGVSGATMTSINVLEGIKALAKADEKSRSSPVADAGNANRISVIPWRDIGSICICLYGVLMGLTRLRAHKRLRFGYLMLVLVYLGFISGDILSAALVVGWSQNGLPYSVAPALILLAAAAFAIPVVSKHNVYCRHICPFGAAQQLVMNRIGWKIRLGKKLSHFLKLGPVLLLALILLTGLKLLNLNLASLEAFDAFAFQIAGWATISIAIGGLIASLFVPLAYCRFGCPTGAALEFLRFNSRSDRLGIKDGIAVGLLALACLV